MNQFQDPKIENNKNNELNDNYSRMDSPYYDSVVLLPIWGTRRPYRIEILSATYKHHIIQISFSTVSLPLYIYFPNFLLSDE